MSRYKANIKPIYNGNHASWQAQAMDFVNFCEKLPKSGEKVSMTVNYGDAECRFGCFTSDLHKLKEAVKHTIEFFDSLREQNDDNE